MKVVSLLVLMAPAALAALPPCKEGLTHNLLGDPFVPVACSSAAASAAPLPAEPEGPAEKPALKTLHGTWDGLLFHGVGRYETVLEVKTGWSRTELVLRWKEQQLRDRGETRLTLAGKRAELRSPLLPEKVLRGEAAWSREPDGRLRLDLAFENGARHRVRWSAGGGVLKFSTVWAVPLAPLQRLDGELRRR